MSPYFSRSRNCSGGRRLALASSSKVRLTAVVGTLVDDGAAGGDEGAGSTGSATAIGVVDGWLLPGDGSSDKRPLITLSGRKFSCCCRRIHRSRSTSGS